MQQKIVHRRRSAYDTLRFSGWSQVPCPLHVHQQPLTAAGAGERADVVGGHRMAAAERTDTKTMQ
jgi:hypothetical protein